MKIITQRTVKRELPKPVVKKPVPKKKTKKTEEPVIKPLIEDNPFLTIDKED